jgi:hypothetical protein
VVLLRLSKFTGTVPSNRTENTVYFCSSEAPLSSFEVNWLHLFSFLRTIQFEKSRKPEKLFRLKCWVGYAGYF